MMDEALDGKEMLCTKEHVKSYETVKSTPKLNKQRSGSRNKNSFLCKDHHVLPLSWEDEVNGRCDV